MAEKRIFPEPGELWLLDPEGVPAAVDSNGIAVVFDGRKPVATSAAWAIREGWPPIPEEEWRALPGNGAPDPLPTSLRELVRKT